MLQGEEYDVLYSWKMIDDMLQRLKHRDLKTCELPCREKSGNEDRSHESHLGLYRILVQTDYARKLRAGTLHFQSSIFPSCFCMRNTKDRLINQAEEFYDSLFQCIHLKKKNFLCFMHAPSFHKNVHELIELMV